MADHQHDSHLARPHEYKVEGSNVELVGSDIDHKVKYNSASTEPAWKAISNHAGIQIWRIEQFEVIPWPKENCGSFFDGDSYIVLHSYKKTPDQEGLSYNIHFWLGKETTQDEAGTAAYKTVELDEYLHGSAIQYREVQTYESEAFRHLFSRLTYLKGGVKTGFNHVEPKETDLFRLLQLTSEGRNGIIVNEVEPRWESLSSSDVFILDEGKKLRAWQGKKSSPMEKAKAAQVMQELSSQRSGATIEVISELDSKSLPFIQTLSGSIDSKIPERSTSIRTSSVSPISSRPERLFRLSDSTGHLTFDMILSGERKPRRRDFESNDVFLYDNGKDQLFVWQGKGASKNEKSSWLKIANAYLKSLENEFEHLSNKNLGNRISIAKELEGFEDEGFWKAIQA